MRTLLAALFLALSLPLRAEVAAPPLAAAKTKNGPGLTLTVTAGGRTDTRAARLVALYVPAGQPVTPFVPAGPFTARWEGNITAGLRAEYTFAAEVRGSFRLLLNDKLVLEGAGDATAQAVNKSFQLSKGANRLVAEFVSDGKEDAMLRLKWWSREFPAEPVPPGVFVHDVAGKELREGIRVREGRMLFAQHRCAACHADATLIPPKGEGMPELAQDAPLFDDLGAKFNEGWLAHWINDPHDTRPHSLMPRVFHGEKGTVDPRAADLAAYFMSLGKRDDTAPAVENAPLGGSLFAGFGCIACHTTPTHVGGDEHGRVPLSHLRAKWQPRALREYLKQPEKNYAWTHMPNFRLTDEEAERLTAFLLAGTQREFTAVPAGDPAKGAQQLVSAGCLNCHAGLPPTTQPTLAATLQGGWVKGCLAPDGAARGQAPDFAFTPAQREALLAFAATGFESLKRDAPVEFAERQLANLRCGACHARDAEPSTWSRLEGEMAPLLAAAPVQPEGGEGAPIQNLAPPILTWAGEKLRPEWMEPFIAGTNPHKPRPWMLARMPGFVAPAKGITEGLALEHGFGLTIEPEPAAELEKAKVGEMLLGESGGFNCLACHGVGERAPTAVFEAPGLNLALTPERLRKGYYHRWVLNPLRIDPDTKMPKYADEEGRTPLTDHFGGEAREQFEAIWQYLRTVKK